MIVSQALNTSILIIHAHLEADYIYYPFHCVEITIAISLTFITHFI